MPEPKTGTKTGAIVSNDGTRIDLGEDLIGIIQKEKSKSAPAVEEVELDKTQIISYDTLTPEVTEGPVFFIPLDQQDAALPEPEKEITSIRTKPETDDDHIESALILIQEGLLDEAKKFVYKVRARNPHHPHIKGTLQRIEEIELSNLYQTNPKKKKQFAPIEDAHSIIRQLNKDLGIFSGNETQQNEMWIVQGKEPADIRSYLDLGLAFYEMGCFEDAIREFRKIIRQVRLDRADLGPEGVSAVHLVGMSLIELGRAFEAKQELKQVLAEPELTSEQQLLLMYSAAEAELVDGDTSQARSWFEKILKINPHYKDVQIRIREIKI